MCVICQFVNGTVVHYVHVLKKEKISQWKIHVISCDLRQNMVCTLRSGQVQNVECLPFAIENEVSCREVGTKPGLARAGINVRGFNENVPREDSRENSLLCICLAEITLALMGKQKWKWVLGLGGSSGVQHGSGVCEVHCAPVSL